MVGIGWCDLEWLEWGNGVGVGIGVGLELGLKWCGSLPSGTIYLVQSECLFCAVYIYTFSFPTRTSSID